MFERTAERLSGMVQIPTVSGKGNEALYEIGRYKEYLAQEFLHLFGSAERLDQLMQLRRNINLHRIQYRGHCYMLFQRSQSGMNA